MFIFTFEVLTALCSDLKSGKKYCKNGRKGGKAILGNSWIVVFRGYFEKGCGSRKR
jgi:hypothetical protein